MTGLELNFLRILESGRNDVFNFIFKTITYLGQGEVLFLLIALFYFVLNKEFAKKFTFISAFSLSVNGVVKNFVERPRPFASIREDRITCVYPDTATGFSFPSGHSQTCAASATTVAKEYKKKWLTIVCVIAILLVMFSRLYLGAHFPTDVLVGAGLGIGAAFLGGFLIDKLGYKKAFLIVTLATLPFIVYFCITGKMVDGLYVQKDLYDGYGLLVGSFLGFMFEEKYVNFSLDKKLWKKLLELALALGVALGLKAVLKMPYDKVNVDAWLYNLLDFARYTIVCFVATGICPWIFKKLKI